MRSPWTRGQAEFGEKDERRVEDTSFLRVKSRKALKRTLDKLNKDL